MRKDKRINKWILILWFILTGAVMTPLSAYTQAKRPSSWQTRPVLSTDRYPAYHFQSTSTCAPVVGQTSYMASDSYSPLSGASPRRARKDSNPWDETPSGDENDNPIGVVEDPAPIGEPWVLLAMAVLYLFYIKSKKIQEKFAQFKKKQ